MSVLCFNCCCAAPAIFLHFLCLCSLFSSGSAALSLTHAHTKVIMITTAHHLPLPGKLGFRLQALASATQPLWDFEHCSRTGGRLLAESSWLKGKALLFQGCLSEAKAELCSGECHADRRFYFLETVLPWTTKGETLRLCPAPGGWRMQLLLYGSSMLPLSFHPVPRSLDPFLICFMGKGFSELQWEFSNLFHCSILTYF